MSDILAKMQAVHNARTMTPVEVPEYDTVWHFPALTMADRAAIRKGVAEGDDVELMVNTMIHMAHDGDGKKVFADDGPSRVALYGMEVAVLHRIMAAADPDAADTETAKND